MVQQAADDALTAGRGAQLGLVVPVGARQHTVKPGGVGVLDGVAGDVECLAQVHRGPGDGGPPGRLRDEELMLVTVLKRHVAGNVQCDGVLHFLIEPVGQPLKEENGEDVVFVVGGIDLSAQDVGGLPQLRLKLLSGQRHRPLLKVADTALWPISFITESRSVSRRSRAASTDDAYAAYAASTSWATVSRSRGGGTGT